MARFPAFDQVAVVAVPDDEVGDQVLAVAELGLPVAVTGYLGLAEKMVQICLCTAPGVATIGQRGGSGRDVARVSVDCMRRAGHVISDEALAAAEAELEQQMPPRAEIPGRLIARAFVSIAAIVFTIVMIRRQKKKEKRIGA